MFYRVRFRGEGEDVFEETVLLFLGDLGDEVEGLRGLFEGLLGLHKVAQFDVAEAGALVELVLEVSRIPVGQGQGDILESIVSGQEKNGE